MCFPSKKQKDNFNDTDKADKKSTTRNGSGTDGKGTKGEQTAVASSSEPPSEPPSATPAPPTLPPVVTTDNSIVMSPPKVAIIIYSMYGHIAKCKFLLLVYPRAMLICRQTLLQWPRRRRQVSRKQEEKAISISEYRDAGSLRCVLPAPI